MGDVNEQDTFDEGLNTEGIGCNRLASNLVIELGGVVDRLGLGKSGVPGPSGLGGGSDKQGLRGGSDRPGLEGCSDQPGQGGGINKQGLGGGSDRQGLGGGSDKPGLGGVNDKQGLEGGSDRPGLAKGSDKPGLRGGSDRPGLGGGIDKPGLGQGSDKPCSSSPKPVSSGLLTNRKGRRNMTELIELLETSRYKLYNYEKSGLVIFIVFKLWANHNQRHRVWKVKDIRK